LWEPGKVNSKNSKKIAVVVVLIGLVAVLRISGLQDHLTLAHLRDSREKLALMYAAHKFSMITAYMVIYILASSLSFPGAVILTIAGGALFGLWTGTVVVSFASAIGATLACFASRFVLRDWVQEKLAGRLRTVNDGIEKEGAFYLFTLRLIPVFPFWIINLVMGLTRMPLRTFYWVSQVGMLPGTIVYVNAGRELAKVESLSAILSPGLILSLAALGLFPIAARKSVALYKSRKDAPRIRE
jgi:uncharacterized membrane protein YdjX (TVP38/TMEM64 family)